MKVGGITFITALLFAWPAFAGTIDCGPTDTDSDGVYDLCDNCSSTANVSQTDADFDGYGNACDADFDNNGGVDLGDLTLLGANWNQTVPPAPAQLDTNDSGGVDLADLTLLGATWGQLPGPACGAPVGTPCPPPYGP